MTRSLVIQLAQKLNIAVREVRFPKERLYEADEIFLTGSIKEIFPVTQIDNYTISKGQPGPLTDALHQAYLKLVPAKNN